MIIIIRVRIQLQDFLWPAIQCTKKAQANLKKYSDKTYKQYVTFAFSALKQIAQTNILNKNFTTINIQVQWSMHYSKSFWLLTELPFNGKV